MLQHSASATTELKSSKINCNRLKIYEATDIPILQTEKLRTKILMMWRGKKTFHLKWQLQNGARSA